MKPLQSCAEILPARRNIRKTKTKTNVKKLSESITDFAVAEVKICGYL